MLVWWWRCPSIQTYGYMLVCIRNNQMLWNLAQVPSILNIVARQVTMYHYISCCGWMCRLADLWNMHRRDRDHSVMFHLTHPEVRVCRYRGNSSALCRPLRPQKLQASGRITKTAVETGKRKSESYALDLRFSWRWLSCEMWRRTVWQKFTDN
jgi:hypothetical protein